MHYLGYSTETLCGLYLDRDVSAKRHVPGLELELDGLDSVPDNLESGLVASLNGHFPADTTAAAPLLPVSCESVVELATPTRAPGDGGEVGVAREVFDESELMCGFFSS